MFTSIDVDANRATSISLALRKIAVILCHHMITFNSQSENNCSSFLSLSQKFGHYFLSCTVQVLSSVN